MSGNIAFIDILIFAVIAIFLALRLHSVLGKRTGFEQKSPRKRDLMRTSSHAGQAAHDAFGGEGAKTDGNAAGHPDGAAGAAAEAAAESNPLNGKGVDAIKKADSGFNKAQFLKGAAAAYRTILAAFAAGDLSTLKRLLGYEIRQGFVDAITERGRNSEALTIKLEKLEQPKITDAELIEGLAVITVEFISRQQRILRDAAGNILEGDEKTATEFRDFWTFERDIASRDPNWLLVETRTADS